MLHQASSACLAFLRGEKMIKSFMCPQKKTNTPASCRGTPCLASHGTTKTRLWDGNVRSAQALMSAVSFWIAYPSSLNPKLLICNMDTTWCIPRSVRRQWDTLGGEFQLHPVSLLTICQCYLLSLQSWIKIKMCFFWRSCCPALSIYNICTSNSTSSDDC